MVHDLKCELWHFWYFFLLPCILVFRLPTPPPLFGLLYLSLPCILLFFQCKLWQQTSCTWVKYFISTNKLVKIFFSCLNVRVIADDCKARGRPGQSQGLPLSGSPTYWQGAQPLGSPAVDFFRPLAGRWIRSRGAGTLAGSDMEWLHHRQWLYPPHPTAGTNSLIFF